MAIVRTAAESALVLLEPDDSVRDALGVLLRGAGWQVWATGDARELERLLDRPGIVAAISESTVPGREAEEVLQVCVARGLPLVFTGHGLPLQQAVDLIRMGARDYLQKPFSQARLLDLLNRLSDRQNSHTAPHGGKP